MSYRWMSWSEWNDLQEPEKTDVLSRHLLIGGAMLVFDTIDELKGYESTHVDPLLGSWREESDK